MEELTIEQIITFVTSGGMWIAFFWLYTQEKKAHQQTREQYRADLREIGELHQPLRKPSAEDKEAPV